MSRGRPSHAFQFSPLYPLAIAAQFFPLWLLYAGMKILLMLLAGYGMFRFLRDYLAFEPGLALLAGVVFAFNAQTQAGQIVHVVFNPVTQLLLIVFLNPAHQGSTGRLLGRWALYWAGYALIFLPVGYARVTRPFRMPGDERLPAPGKRLRDRQLRVSGVHLFWRTRQKAVYSGRVVRCFGNRLRARIGVRGQQ